MIVYASRTGNVQYIVNQLDIPSVKIHDELIVEESYLLFTYTDGLGNVPKDVAKFISHNYHNCKGVIASGNSNFGKNVFCASADKLNEMYNIPVIHKIELRGFKKDYDLIVEKYKLIIGEG